VRVSVDDVRLYFEVFGQEYAISPDAESIVRRPTLIGLHGGPARGVPKAVYVDYVPRHKIDILCPT
jgi:hypothetical protein